MANVLVVDDEPDVLAIMARTVREICGHRAITAATAAAALRSCEHEEVEAAVIDWRLPDEDGLVLFKRLKARLPNLIGLIVTGFHSYDHAEECLNAGISGYMPKPFKPDELAAKLNRVLRIHDAIRASDDEPDFDGMGSR